jgi:hypothetical protein
MSCEHVWIYSDEMAKLLISPPIRQMYKICELCGEFISFKPTDSEYEAIRHLLKNIRPLLFKFGHRRVPY